MSLQGTIRQGVIILDQPPDLPEGTRVEIAIKPLPGKGAERKPTLAERLLKHAGTIADLPSDMAEQHDHYIHGTPKR